MGIVHLGYLENNRLLTRMLRDESSENRFSTILAFDDTNIRR